MNPVPHILLAEDDACLARLLLHALEKLNPPPKIVHVPDGAEVLDRLRLRRRSPAGSSELPSVVILDLKMPKIGGLEVLRRIRSNGRLRLLPVVMLTSSQNDRDLRACYESGANACVVKPIGFQQLMAVIRHLGIFWTQINRSPPPARQAFSHSERPEE
jgi:CheY-like chemotaxis protein